MKKLNKTSQTHSDVLNVKSLATMEMNAMDTLFVVNVEKTKPNHNTIDCNLNNRCVNCSEDHPSYKRSCLGWKNKNKS